MGAPIAHVPPGIKDELGGQVAGMRVLAVDADGADQLVGRDAVGRDQQLVDARGEVVEGEYDSVADRVEEKHLVAHLGHTPSTVAKWCSTPGSYRSGRDAGMVPTERAGASVASG